jgi:hypothetical protein
VAEVAQSPPLTSAASVTGDAVRGILVYRLRTVVRLALYSYNTVTLVSLAAFRTIDVGEFGSRLQQYPTVNTSHAQYTAMAALFIVMLVVVVAGGPIALFVYLTRCYRHGIVGREREAVEEVERAAQTSDTVALVLTASFKPQYWCCNHSATPPCADHHADIHSARGGLPAHHCRQRLPYAAPAAMAVPARARLCTRAADSRRTVHTGKCDQRLPDSAIPAKLDYGLLWLLFVTPFAVGVSMAFWLRYRISFKVAAAAAACAESPSRISLRFNTS